MDQGRKRKREDTVESGGNPIGWEEARDRVAKRRKKSSLILPARLLRKDHHVVTDEDVWKELRKSANNLDGGRKGYHQNRPLHDSDPFPIISNGRGNNDHNDGSGGDSEEVVVEENDDIAETLDFETLRRQQQENLKKKNAYELMDRLVERISTFQTLNKIVSQWLTAKFIGCMSTNDHISLFVRYIVTEQVRFRVFKSKCGTKDELYLIGTKIEFSIPFTFFDENVKVAIAMVMKRHIMFFEKCHIVKQGVCGKFYSEFKYGECLEAAMQKHRMRDQLLQHFTLCVLHSANQVGRIRSAVSTLVTMASNVIGKFIAPVHANTLYYSDREMRMLYEMEGAINSMFKFLLDAKLVATAVLSFSKKLEKYGPAIAGVPRRAQLTYSATGRIQTSSRMIRGGPGHHNRALMQRRHGNNVRK